MIRRPPRSTLDRSSAASDVYKRQPTEYLGEFFSLIQEIILHPGFKETDFDRLISNQKNYVDEVIRQSSDEEYGKKYLEYVLFKGTPYEHLTQGDSKSLASLTKDDVFTHYRRAYTRSNLVIGIAGDYPNEFAEKMQATFNQLPEGPAPIAAVSYTHLRAHETVLDLVCRLLLEKKKHTQ